MKILIVVMNYYPSIGGTQFFFQHLAEYCVHHLGCEVQVYTTDSYYGPEKDNYKKIEQTEEYINGVFVKRFAYYRWHRKPFLLAQKACIKLFNKSSDYLSIRRTGPWSSSLQKAIKNTDADIIVGATATYKYMIYPLIRYKLNNGKPFIYQGALHFDVNKKEQYITPHVLNSIKQSEFYLANSDYEKAILESKGVHAESIKVLGIAVEHNLSKSKFDSLYRQELQITSKQPLIAFVGRISELKSIDILLNAMLLVCKMIPDACLVIAGEDNGYAKKLRESITTFPTSVKKNIHFRLSVNEYEKNSIYNSIDLLVLPSKSESFGLVFLEAWAFKKAVIGAKIGAINSIIDDGVDGILFNPDDVSHLAACITDVLQNDTKRKRLGEAGHHKLLSTYTWDIVGGKFKTICEKAIKKFKSTKQAID